MVKYGILGGGWAGLLSAYAIKKANPTADIEILEKSHEGSLGGLLRSETIDGFTYDTGGPHILFSRNKEILNTILEILGENWKQMERKNFVHFEGKIIPYPFENGIYLLPPEDRAKIGLGIIENLFKLNSNKDWIPDTFYDWIYGIFGFEMGHRYLEPYNKKIWKRNLKEFDASWVFTPGRLPLPTLEDIVNSISGLETTGYKEQAHFFYPNNGGIQTLYESLLKLVKSLGVKFITSVNVKTVSKNESDMWVVNNSFQYDRIIGTIPLVHLVNALDAPKIIKEYANNLDYNRVVVIGFALDQPAPDRIALYVPEDDVVFHRYTWMSNLVNGSPRGKSNLIVEVTIPKWLPIDEMNLLKQAGDGLVKIGIISGKEKIIHSKIWVHEFGYPVYMKGHNENRDEIMDYLNSLGIKSVGRWGSWHYWNTDKVLEAVKKTIKSD